MSFIKKCNASLRLNAEASEILSNELAAFAAKGQPCIVKYSSDLGRVAAFPVHSEKTITFLETDKDGKPLAKGVAKAFFSVWVEDQTSVKLVDY